MTDELAPRLLAALKKLDEERPEFAEHVQPVRETKIEWVGGEIADCHKHRQADGASSQVLAQHG